MSISIFYVPQLHHEAVHGPVPPGVSFFPVGLPETPASAEQEQGGASDTDARALASEAAVAQALPLNPPEARAVLEDMLRMGEEYAPNGLLRQLAAHELLQTRRESWAGAPGEFADLDTFAATGETPAARQPRVPDWGAAPAGQASAIRNALVDCQKVLLLTHFREERLLELSRLEKRYLEVEKALVASLGEGDEEDAALWADKGAEPGAPEDAASGQPAVPWRVLVDAVLPFLPENGVLFTSDRSMSLDLRELGMLHPFPEDRAALCADWPQELVAGLLHARLPAWRLVGRKRPMAERPWLDRNVEIFVSRPSAGWLEAPGAGA